MEISNTRDEIMESINETQTILNKLFLSLESTVFKFDQVRHEALLSRAKHLTLTECKFMKDALDRVNQASMANIGKLSDLAETLDLAKIKLKKSLRYFNPDGPTKVTFQSGNPWELYLKPIPCQNEEIQQILKEMYEANKLENITDPDKFDVVCVYRRNICYRGLIIDIIQDKNHLTILNVDRCYSTLVPIENVYELPSQLLDIPIQILKCSLIPMCDNLKEFWSHDAADLFLLVVSESELSVNVTDKIKPELPPIFSVKMMGKLDDIQVDINSWLSSTVLPMLPKWNNNPQRYKDVYTLFPFINNIFKQESPKSENTEKSIKNGKLSPIKKSNDSESVSVNESNNSQYIAERESSKTEKSNNSEQITPNNESIKSQSLSPAESIALSYISHVAVNNSPYDSDPEVNSIYNYSANGDMSNTHHDATKHDKYQSQDEYCDLFLRNKRCWITNCKKLHKHPSGKWTDDKMETLCTIYNRINLPKLLDDVTFEVIEISSANSFYIYLHPNYPDTDELIVNDVNSLNILEKELNCKHNIQRYKSYTTDPLLGEILLFHDDTHGYRRAKLVERFDQSAHIFLIDYGFYETVPLTKIRKIEQEFLQLPAQAVYTTLENTVPIPEKAERAKSFLNYKIRGKVFKAKVFRRNVVDSELSVELYLDDSSSLNQLLLDKGYCTTCKSSL